MNKSSFHKISSWSDFKERLSALNKKEKGNYFELLTKLYFKINPVFSFYDDVWLFNEVPSKVLEYLGLPSLDLGIDLLAKHGNDYHAIQCKYHSDQTTSITFKEVSTFISLLESNDKISQGYICSSADLTSRNFNKLKTKPINLIMSDSWQLLDDKFFSAARKILEGKKVKITPLQPRPHQKKALEESKNYFIKEDQSRGKLIFPCGAGKSLTGFWMAQKLKSKATLIAVPSLSLVKQILEVYLREIVANKKQVKWLCICSDEGIGKNDDVVFYTENLGVPCQTDPEYIENWLRENVNQEIVIFTTYQSGRIIAEISQKLDFTFDVGIFDEAHKTVGSDKKLFSHLLFDENISINKRIFMTATERFYAGKKDDIISMDDESIYGDTFTQISFKEAIESGLLTDYKVITIDVKKSEIADFIKENNLVQLNDKWKKETEARSLASMLALRKAMKQFPIKNAVSFHSSIEKAVRNKELQTYITDTYHYKPIDTFTVSGKQPTTKRNVIVNEFASSDKALITNARCLTEGVDVPNIDCIVFADPRKSKVDIVQALGRALRKKEGKEWGYVILPVVYDEKTHEIDNDNFQEIMAIVRGLASNDERILEYFKDKSKKKGKLSDGGSQFTFELFSDYIYENELSDQLQIKLWEKLSRFNWMPFEEAREYVRGLGLNSGNDWREYTKSDERLKNIPTAPDKIYKNEGWKNWGDWLGTGYISTQDRVYKEFYDAKSFVRSLKLSNTTEWKSYCKSSKRPSDIPSNPHSVYKGKGWIDYGDWLGTNRVSDNKRVYWDFQMARDFVHKLGLKSQTEWRNYCKTGEKPNEIPSVPNNTYKNQGWEGYGDWLGTGSVANRGREYRDFNQARIFARSLKLSSEKEWKEFCDSGQLPNDIPKYPQQVYRKKGWKGIGDWLGTGVIAKMNRTFRSFEEARTFVRSLNLRSSTEWYQYTKSGRKPNDIPGNPRVAYKEDWKGFPDWLGTKYFSRKDFRSFDSARSFARSLNLKSANEWRQFSKTDSKPDDVPATPHRTYKNSGWRGYGDWLGYDQTQVQIRNKYNTNFRSYEEAKVFVHSLNLNTVKEWTIYCASGNRPDDIPTNPSVTYKNSGWRGYGDWLGTDNESNKNRVYLSFSEARQFARSLQLKSSSEWIEFTKNDDFPKDIPKYPRQTYIKKGWKGYGDWLGTGEVAPKDRKFLNFEEAKKYVHRLKLSNRSEWREYSKSDQRPSKIPSDPARVYKNNGWKGFSDWLGVDQNKKYLPYEDALKITLKLGIKNRREWLQFIRKNQVRNIPNYPDQYYKDNGWISWADFLGKEL